MADLFYIPTLMICFFGASMVIALFVTAVWLKDPKRSELFYWAAAYWSGAIGVLFLALRMQVPFWVSVGLGNTLVVLCCALFWLGARAFDRRSLPLRLAFAGPAIWVAALVLSPSFAADINARIILISVLVFAYSLAVAFEVWRGRTLENLPTRLAVVFFFSSHAVVYLLRIPFAIWSPTVVKNGSPYAGWYGLFTFELFIHAIFSGIAIFALIKERAELRYRIASEIDPLTGVLNRRAFMERAEQRLHGGGDGMVMLLDLDHFKSINDTYGHGGGDAVLVSFSQLVGGYLDKDMIFGRIGGEEFAIFAPGMDDDRGVRLAERICAALAANPIEFGDCRMYVTVSVGLCDAGSGELSQLLAIADSALYVAKADGRNRVNLADPAGCLKRFTEETLPAGAVSEPFPDPTWMRKGAQKSS